MTTLEIMQLLTAATEQWKNMCAESSECCMDCEMRTQTEIIKKLQKLLLSNLNNDERTR